MLSKIAISIGDVNGVGLEICIKAHKKISKICEPIYCVNQDMLHQAEDMLSMKMANPNLCDIQGSFKIKPSKLGKKSGRYSFESFQKAISLCESNQADALVTMPINKQSWEKAGIKYKGHTDYLRDYFKQDAIMMLGYDKLFVSLFTDHIPLSKVSGLINTKDIKKFLLNFYQKDMKKVGVLGVNPHSGDNGVLGNEDILITNAIKKANKKLNNNVFVGPLVPDVAFTKRNREKYKYFVAMYHDQGLAPLKALQFDETINISLNLPIIRASVGHGSAFDIAYKKNNNLSIESYCNAVKYCVKASKIKNKVLK